MNKSVLDYSEREDALTALFEEVENNPLVDVDASADLMADYYGYLGTYLKMGYLRILTKLQEDAQGGIHATFLNSFVDPNNTITVLMAIHNYIK